MSTRSYITDPESGRKLFDWGFGQEVRCDLCEEIIQDRKDHAQLTVNVRIGDSPAFVFNEYNKGARDLHQDCLPGWVKVQVVMEKNERLAAKNEEILASRAEGPGTEQVAEAHSISRVTV